MDNVYQEDNLARNYIRQINKEDTMDHLNIDRFLKVWAEILSDHYGVDIKFTAKRKEEAA